MKNTPTSQLALLVVDMQTAYFNNKALRDKQAELIHNVNELMTIADNYSLPVFNIKTEHQKDIATWTLNMLDDKQGYLFRGDVDADNVAGLHIERAIEVLKTRDSSFVNTPLSAMLKNHGVTTIIICGVSTHTCILQTAADAYAANFRVILAREAIASHQPNYHESTLTLLQSEYRQDVMNNDQLEQYIQNNSQRNT